MDRFFIDKSNINLIENICFIEGEDVKHISKVLRYKKGDILEICDKEDSEYICEISDIRKNEVQLKILEKIHTKRELSLNLKVYQGLPKGQKMEYIVQKLTEIGVKDIIPVITMRSVSKIDDKKEDKKLDRWERIVYEASKQSKRGIIPRVHQVMTIDDVILDMKNNDLNIVAYENEKNNTLKEALKGKIGDSVGIFIGPEGGFEEEEIEKLKNNGVISVSLGKRILRTETAPVFLSSIILYELCDIGGDE